MSENMVKVAAERGTLQQLLQHCSHELEAQQQAPGLVRHPLGGSLLVGSHLQALTRWQLLHDRRKQRSEANLPSALWQPLAGVSYRIWHQALCNPWAS